jgi:hypothetical protein
MRVLHTQGLKQAFTNKRIQTLAGDDLAEAAEYVCTKAVIIVFARLLLEWHLCKCVAKCRKA